MPHSSQNSELAELIDYLLYWVPQKGPPPRCAEAAALTQGVLTPRTVDAPQGMQIRVLQEGALAGAKPSEEQHSPQGLGRERARGRGFRTRPGDRSPDSAPLGCWERLPFKPQLTGL